jgi:hypothetical protein
MNPARLMLFAVLTAAGLFSLPLSRFAAPLLAPPPPQISNAAPSDAPVIYVSDFDLDIYRPSSRTRRPPSSPSNGSNTSPSAAASGSSSGSSVTPRPAASTSPPRSSSSPARSATRSNSPEADADDIKDRANELINLVAENLVSALQRAGYSAQRLRLSQPRPERGLLIRGVFAEPDDMNRARRLLFGGPATSPNMLLYVGINNLSNPEQPLYEFANPQAPDPKYGPVITVTSYSPAVRFELAKDPSDEEIKKIAGQITADLTALLNANPLLAGQ